MRYKYKTHSNNGNAAEVAASIKETQSDLWVAVNLKVDDAKRLTKHLNLGGGFDGHTPSFFCEKIKQSGV